MALIPLRPMRLPSPPQTSRMRVYSFSKTRGLLIPQWHFLHHGLRLKESIISIFNLKENIFKLSIWMAFLGIHGQLDDLYLDLIGNVIDHDTVVDNPDQWYGKYTKEDTYIENYYLQSKYDNNLCVFFYEHSLVSNHIIIT